MLRKCSIHLRFSRRSRNHRRVSGLRRGRDLPRRDAGSQGSGAGAGHVASAASRVHFANDSYAGGCPSRARAGEVPHYLVPDDRVILCRRHDAFICAAYIDAKGSDRLVGWLPADAVADDTTEPVA
jgi:hypothetical protein